MGQSDSSDCGLPLKRGARRFGEGRFLHRLSDGWSRQSLFEAWGRPDRPTIW
jgi:hypothetical protein